MRDYREIADVVFRRGDEMIAAKKRRSALMIRTVCAVSGLCAAAVIGLGIWNSSALRGAISPDPDNGYVDIQDETKPTEQAVTTNVTAQTTAPSETRVTATETVTVTETTPSTAAPTPARTTHRPVQTTIIRTTTVHASTQTSVMTTTRVTDRIPDEGLRITTSRAPDTPNVPVVTTSVPKFYGSLIDFNGVNYSSREEYELSTEIIGERLGKRKVNVKYYNGYHGKTGSKTVVGEIFAINDVSSRFMVAVRYKGEEEYYSYRNSLYFPANLGELISDSGMERYWTAESAILGTDMKYSSVDSSMLWETVLADGSVPAVDITSLDPKDTAQRLSFVTHMDGLFTFGGGFWVTDSGYLCTNLIPTGAAFYVGEERVNDLISRVTESGTPEKLTSEVTTTTPV